VKTDDPRLEKSRQEMFERVEKMNALTLAVLRSHLLAEQCMGDYLIASGKKPKWVRKQKFWTKIERCKKLAKREGDDDLWRILATANHLRNSIAHTLSSEEIAEKMKQLKDQYFAYLTAEQAAGLADEPDDFIAQSACLTCAGFIATLTKGLAEKSVEGSTSNGFYGRPLTHGRGPCSSARSFVWSNWAAHTPVTPSLRGPGFGVD
jgi:hypothetical protein